LQVCVDNDDLVTSEALHEARRRSFVTVMAAAFSPDGKFIAGGTSEGRIYVWSVSKYKQEQPPRTSVVPPTVSFPAHSGTVYCLAFTQSKGKLVLTSGGDENVKLWDWATVLRTQGRNSGIQPLAELNTPRKTDDKGVLAPVAEINGVACFGSKLYAAVGDGNAYEWELNSGSPECTGAFEGHTGYLQCIGLSKLLAFRLPR